MVARLNHLRLGATRLDYYLPEFLITINGSSRESLTRVHGVSIRDYLDGQPNTATLRVSGFTPEKGHEVKMALGQMDRHHFLFCGHIIQTRQVYEGVLANLAWDLDCISYEWLLNRRKVTERYTNINAGTIAADIIATYTSGFTSTAIKGDTALVVDEITFTNEEVTDALDRLARRIGGYWYIDTTKNLHFFLTETDHTAGPIVDAAVRSARHLSVATDLSQVRTRVYMEGGGSNASADVAVGQTTIPVDNMGWYNAGGGVVVSGPQRITYTGISAGDGTGSKVGGKTGLAPGALTVAAVAGTAGNLSVGAYLYKVVLVINEGKTEAGTASASASIAHVTAPGTAGSAAGGTGGSMTTGDTYLYVCSYLTGAGETTAGGLTEITLSGGNTKVTLTSIPTSADGRVTKRRLYRVNYSTGVWTIATTINDNSTTSYEDTAADSSLVAASLPVANTSGSGQMSLTAIPTGPAGTTAREVHRTVAGGSEYKYLLTVSGNVTTTATDNIGDTSLGQAAPSASTVGPSAADTSLQVQELSFYASGGGWVEVSGQLIRFTGRSAASGAGTLTGVPASGIGALTVSVPYDTPVINWPHLTGVSGVLYSLNKGDALNLLVTVNDGFAQSAMATYVGGDGIHELYESDNRLSETEATDRANALLTLMKDPLVTVDYDTRDQTTRTGRTVAITLTAPSVSGTFKIQSVTLMDFDAAGLRFPLRRVQVSSRRFSFENLLRQLKGTAPA